MKNEILEKEIIIDERNSREGKGVPIYRPKYIARDQPVRRL